MDVDDSWRRALTPALGPPADTPRSRTATGPARLEQRALWLTAALLANCLLLQRFALPVSGRTLGISGPIGLVLVVFGFASGALRFHKARLIAYVAFCTLVIAGAAWQALRPGGGGDGENANSRVMFLLLTAFATGSFGVPVEEAAFFRLVTRAFLLVAAAGIAQFAAQFIGLRLFAFSGLLPDWMLIERFYNLEIPVGVGSLLKSNGLVLIEPSVFSQFMALALIIEAVGPRRVPVLATFAAGLLLSFSGTGWLVLAAFVIGAAITMGWRGIATGAGMIAMLGLCLAATSLVAPDLVAALVARLGEIQQPGTSGHMRFVTPFWMLSDVFTADPSAVLFGIGSGRGELLTLPYDYAVNTAIKVLAEYGSLVLVAYVLLFLLGGRTRIQATLVLPCLVLFFLTGGYQDFAPILFIVLLLISVARLRETDPPMPIGAVSLA